MIITKGWLGGDPREQLEAFREIYDRRKQEYGRAFTQGSGEDDLGQVVQLMERNVVGSIRREDFKGLNTSDAFKNSVRFIVSETITLVRKTLGS